MTTSLHLPPDTRLELAGMQRAKYFAPVGLCGFIALICLALIVTSRFLAGAQESIAITAAGLFGLALSAGLGVAFLWIQLRELRFVHVLTQRDPHANYQRVMALAQSLDWRIRDAHGGTRLSAQTCDSLLHQGELVTVQFHGPEALIACICDPDVGYSLLGRQRCRQHRERIRSLLLTH